ncbi:microcin C transport system substrate-binding protein [Pseudomonas duriflava]|uniref:Microcin C transport system substrate-binding protein n=1 Tax=Pseudomonas duriflava TaxID=459528 RepID=A0A562Q8V6_9PSED|nr:extracellular solute-binding protein [Pseudomonas duriflava]TWI53163.1 microcin C transport system substrate-binding protein [Pseudomonas duriflava]
MQHLTRIWIPTVLLILSLACQSIAAAPQHALTLYNEPPKYPAGFTHFDYVNPDAPKGGTLRLSSFGHFDTLNPFNGKGAVADQIGLLYDSLTFHALDEPFTEYGLLAEKIEKANDNSFVRFYLRPQARFNDGTPVTAEDVVFTFNILMKHGDPFYRSYYADVKEVVVEAPRQVRFDFKTTHNRELPLILGQLQILPKHAWVSRDFTKTTLEPPLGSGPYRVTQVQPGRAIRLERVKDWWGKDLPETRGFYNFDTITIDYYRDQNVALEAFKAGQFDLTLETSAKNWATAYNTPALHEGRIIKAELPNNQPQGMQGFVFNLRRAQFKDKRVRQAIALLFDFEWSNRQLFYGAYKRNNSYFENSELAARGLPGPDERAILEPLREQLPASVFKQPPSLPQTDGSGIIRPFQRVAYQLLLEAGYRIEDNRMVDAQGTPLRFEFMLAQPAFERVLLPFKRNLAEIGIDMQLRNVDLSQYINRIRSRDFDMLVFSWGQGSSPGNEQREFWHSSSADDPGSRNLIGLRDPAIDRLVEGLIAADSRSALVSHTRALDRVLMAGYYVIPNWYTDRWRIAYWNRFGRPAKTPSSDYGLMTWWQTHDKAVGSAIQGKP